MRQIKFNNRKILLIVLVAIGILLLLYNGKPSENISNSDNSTLVLEEKIANMIEQTYCVKRVSVIITYDTFGEKITASGPVDTDKLFGTERGEPFVVSEKLPYVRGVLISADNLTQENSEKLQYAVATLLGINSSKVNVIYSE